MGVAGANSALLISAADIPGAIGGGTAGGMGAISTGGDAGDVLYGIGSGVAAGIIPLNGPAYDFGSNFFGDLAGQAIGSGSVNDLNYLQAFGSGLGGCAWGK